MLARRRVVGNTTDRLAFSTTLNERAIPYGLGVFALILVNGTPNFPKDLLVLERFWQDLTAQPVDSLE